MGVFVQVNKDSVRRNLNPIGYTIEENGCWEWVGFKVKGYGRWKDGGSRTMIAHRRVYEMHKGPIPDDLTLDHLCRNRGCVNPDHLEPVTNQENVLRGMSPVAENARKKVCKRGHSNWHIRANPENRLWRVCRTCDYERASRYRAERRQRKAKRPG